MKPENVLLNESSLGIHSKLCDFATAKDVSEKEQKRAFSFVGSAEYISPELLGDGVNEKYSCFESDLWAAGGICYFMLSGLPPFHSDGEYLTFRKVEKLDFSYPEGFHEIGKELISSLLVKNPTERLGANKKNHDIKSHGFFEGIEWETLTKQKSPPIESYQMVLSPESEYSGIFDEEALCKILADESYDLQISSVDDESCHGIPSLLENSKYESLVKDQRLNKSNIANRWNSFVNGELILKLGYVLKLKGLFLEKRMMLLTGGRKDNPPKIIFVDADSWEKVGSTNITKDTEINPLSVARFTIINGEKKFDLIERNSFVGSLDGAFQWVAKLKKVQLQYFK